MQARIDWIGHYLEQTSCPKLIFAAQQAPSRNCSVGIDALMLKEDLTPDDRHSWLLDSNGNWNSHESEEVGDEGFYIEVWEEIDGSE
jgi:hypothetical protein